MSKRGQIQSRDAIGSLLWVRWGYPNASFTAMPVVRCRDEPGCAGADSCLWICGVSMNFALSRPLFSPGNVNLMDAINSHTLTPDAIEEIARLLVEHAEDTLDTQGPQ